MLQSTASAKAPPVEAGNSAVQFSFFSSTTTVGWFNDPFVSLITNPSGEEEEEEEEVWACGFSSDGGCGSDGFMFLF